MVNGHVGMWAEMAEMTTILLERGKVKGRGIVFPKRLTLPEGTEVMVRIEPVVENAKIMARTEDLDLGDLPFFGMWADCRRYEGQCSLGS